MSAEKKLLSSRLRPNVECAPWVVVEVQGLERRLGEVEAAFEAQQAALNELREKNRLLQQRDDYVTGCLV